MKELIVTGGNRLSGALPAQGAKNSVLPLLAAAVLFREPCVLRGCPRLTDVDAAVEILEHLGCRVLRQADRIWVDSRALRTDTIPPRLMQTMRSSILFLGPVLARLGSCRLCQPGGCRLGSRPIDLHLKGLEALGAEVYEEDDCLVCRGRLRGCAITLPFPSVGATENLILAALGAEGITTIYNAAREPEVGDLIGLLVAGGAEIYGQGTAMLQIQGGFPQAAEYRVMPDRMEAATLLAAVAGTGGDLCLTGAAPGHLRAVVDVLKSAGCRFTLERDAIHMTAPQRLRAVLPIRTGPYPAFPTDAQATVMAALLRAEGVTVLEENVFSDRFRHVPALLALGARVRVAGSVAVVTGVPRLLGARMEATDLRGGAAMAVAALQAEGESRISGIGHILRGYEDFHLRLQALGGNVQIEAAGP